MKKNIFKIILTLFVIIILLVTFVLVKSILNVKLTKKLHTPLFQTKYYGKVLKGHLTKILQLNFSTHIIFFTPWKKEQRKLYDNEFVSLDDYGFRISKTKNNSSNILLLGGSTSFGYFSTSNETTIASNITSISDFNTINRNAPNWNSYQELLALLHFDKKYSLSISLSFHNDIATYCNQQYFDEPIKDIVSNFNILNEKFDPSSNKVNHTQWLDAIDEKIKFIKFLFLNELKKTGLQNIITQNPSAEKSFCENNFDIVEVFLRNQSKMRKISESRGAKHILILQPHELFHKDYVEKNLIEKKEYYKKFVNLVLSSKFCEYDCYDFSDAFLNYKNNSIFYNPEKTNIENVIFIDTVHLSDYGNKILAEKIVEKIR